MRNYEFTEPKIKNQIQELLSKNVHVQLILEDNMYQQYKSMYTPILNMFSGYKTFEIKSDNQMRTEYVHSKVDIMDNAFLIKTANFTHSSLFSNREYMFLSANT
ncbi:MAG: phospholipase D-like domain-containing protein [bacterium]